MEELLNSLFGNKFNLDKFQEFIGELFNQTPRLKGPYSIPNLIDGAQIEFSKLEINQDDLPLNEQIDVVVIKILNGGKGSIEKARTRQRNIISNHLKIYGKGKTHILAVFYSPEDIVWRLSYVEQDFKFINGKVTDELTPAKRFSFLIDPKNSRNVTVKKNFKSLMSDTITPTVSQIKSAFSVEAVTTDFFNDYKLHYSKLLQLFKADEIFQEVERISNQGDENFAENFVKKLMGQIVFLYFLQKKGWLGVKNGESRGTGSQSFIRDLYNEMLSGGDSKKENGGINFFNDYLEWLFYDTLNRNRGEEHWSDYFNTKIPYLNGGLFEPVNGYIWNGPEHIIFKGNEKEANDAFGKLLDFFDLYNFTVYENDPLEQDVAVDPEMLGKIFENLLPENERKGKGSFYTPREIVHYMCKESLKEYLIRKTGLEEVRIERLIKLKDSMETMKKFEAKGTTKEQLERYAEFEKDSKNIDEALSSVKIIDPAVGSGAFPMGILKEIVSLRTYIQRNIFLNEDKDLSYKLKKQALENNIYGVDIDPGAVDIAKLRFWLSLIIENDTQNIEPLPNLDYKVMQGNSLLDELVIGDASINIINDEDLESNKISRKLQNYGGSGLFDDQLETTVLVQKLKFLHKKFFLEKLVNEKKKLKLEIDSIEKQLIRAGCEEGINRYQVQIDNIVNKKTLGIDISSKEEKLLEELRINIETIKQTENKFNEDHIRPFFPRKLHFGDVFKDNGGFDIVIGNPPYVQLQKDGGALGKLYENRGFETFTKMGDLYCLFYEKGIKLLKQNGILGYITSNKWMRAGYGENLRKFFSKNTNPIYLIDLGPGIFETATVDTNILICEKGNNTNIKLKGIDLTKKDIVNDVKDYYNEAIIIDEISEKPWTIVSNLEKSIKDKIEKIGIPLSEHKISINYGIKTGYNEAFIINGDMKDKLISLDPKNSEVISPILRGRDIGRYKYDFQDLYLIYIPWHFPLHNDNTIEGASYKAEEKFKNEYKSLYEYLSQYKTPLSQRNKSETGIRYERYALQRWGAKYYKDFSKKKIIYPCIMAKEPCFMLDNKGQFSTPAPGNIITGENLEYILGLLNSKLCYFALRKYYMGGGIEGELKTNRLLLLPVPEYKDTVGQRKISEYVSKITENIDNGNIFNDDIENIINIIVYKLYELTYDEVKTVDPNFSLTEAEYNNYVF